MNDEIMQMYQLVIEGRALETIVGALAAFIIAVLAITFFGAMFFSQERDDERGAFIVAIAGLFVAMTSIAACGGVKYSAALHPTQEDLQTVGAYKVGKQLLESEKTQRALDAIINKLETKDHE